MSDSLYSNNINKQTRTSLHLHFNVDPSETDVFKNETHEVKCLTFAKWNLIYPTTHKERAF